MVTKTFKKSLVFLSLMSVVALTACGSGKPAVNYNAEPTAFKTVSSSDAYYSVPNSNDTYNYDSEHGFSSAHESTGRKSAHEAAKDYLSESALSDAFCAS